MYSQSPPAARSNRPWVLALIIVTALAAIAVLVVAAMQPGRVVAGNALPADQYGPQDTATHTPSTTTTTTTAAKAVIPAVTPGWQTAYSVSRSAAYDVPADWKVPSPTTIVGFEGNGLRAVMSGASNFNEKACGDYSPRAIAGITGSKIADLAGAARDVADTWSKAATADSGNSNSTITLSAAETLTIQGRAAAHVTATITNQGPVDCKNTPSAVLHAVALTDKIGQAVVMVIYADQGVADAATADTMRKMYTTVRPANLAQADCKQDNVVVGTWC
ncbi:MAG: hypothetical protein JWN03_8590 [Nocardia sp.]|uniref:hypothetical protein n=1 Tax=Nocardia sp. TaxID=1821 RepID=UPI002622DCF4|nr:hypothetical protein [Nocardia sp.]MCU1648315.1 hypothetical protein [Nocardia sp.]